MKYTLYSSRVLWFSLFAAALLISIILFVAFRPARTQRVVFFPRAVGTELTGERRVVPVRNDPSEDVALLVGEALYGPNRLENSRVVPRETRLRGVIVRGNRAFIDLSDGILSDSPDLNLTFSESLEAIRHTVHYNFRDIEDVLITVEGEVPYGRAERRPRAPNG